MGEQRAEELMLTYGEELIEQGRQKGQAEGLATGLARGRAVSVLQILAARSVHVPDNARQRILSCTDLAALDQWFERALTATQLSDVLGDLAQ